MISLTHLIVATAVVFVLLAGWLAHRGRVAWQRGRQDDFAVADRAPTYAIPEEDQFVTEIRAAAADVRTTVMDALPSAAARTAQLTALSREVATAPQPVRKIRTDVPYPGDDHIITGKIVPIRDVYEAGTTRIMKMVDEFRTDWHWIEGKLHAPTALLDSLPQGDWLRDLLAVA